MPQYDSTHTGQQIDEAVDIVLGNKSKGDSTTPVYLDADGLAVAITKDSTPTDGSANPITSGGVYTALDLKVPMESIDSSTSLGTSDTKLPTSGAVKSYVEGVMAPKQDPVSEGLGLNIENNIVSVDTNYEDITTSGDLDNKWGYFSNFEEGNGEDLANKMAASKTPNVSIDTYILNNQTVSVPYTWSKAGNKVVDAQYSESAESVYDNLGYSSYDVLNETDKTYKLSTIKGSELVSSYTNGSTQTRKFANQFIKQQGTCTSGVPVTLPVPFPTFGYFLSVPYVAGSKNRTGFTPLQTGDWIAEGS